MPRELLLVEDDEDLQRLFQRVLERAGYRVKAVSDLASARRALFTQQVHIVVLDEVLPDGSGLSFIREQRADGWRTPVVWVSGFDRGQEARDRADAAGVSIVLQKPVSPEHLVDQVCELVPPVETTDEVSGIQPLEGMLGSTRGGLAVQLAGRVAQLSTVIAAVFEGNETPLAARRYAAAVRARARRSGFPKLARVLTEVSGELSVLNLSEPADHPGHHATLRSLLERAQREVPGPGDDAVTVTAPRLLVVSSRAAHAVELMSEASALGLHLHVVPTLQQGLAYASSKPIRGALLGPVVAASLEAATQLRAHTNESELPIAFLGRPDERDQAESVLTLRGAVILDENLPAGALVLELVDLLQSAERVATMTVLLVEEDLVFAESASQFLRAQGVEVVVRDEVDELGDLLAEVAPELVIVSTDLDQDRGWALTRELRENEEWRHIPLVLSLADGSPEARSRCYAAGANDYLLKPLVPEALANRVHAWIALSRLRVGERRRDGLTGLRTRQGTLAELERRASLGEPQVAFLIRLEPGVGAINERHGFAVADELIRALAAQVLQLCRGPAVAGRWSGGSLIVGVPHASRSSMNSTLTQGLSEVAVGEGAERVDAGVLVVRVVPGEGEDLARALRRM